MSFPLQPDRVREQMERILASTVFRNKKKVATLLRFLVDAALEEREITESDIAMEAFEKTQHFTPMTDSSVRSAASHLRTKLREYYASEGSADSIRIVFPSGGYVAIFDPKLGRADDEIQPKRTGFEVVTEIEQGSVIAANVKKAVHVFHGAASGGTGNTECPEFDVAPEIAKALNDQNLELDVIDEYIELEADERGWGRSAVRFENLGPYEAPATFERLMDRFKAKEPIRGYYSLQDVESSVRDEEQTLTVYASGGDWRHIYALNEIRTHDRDDEECRDFRSKCLTDIMLSEHSWLYRNINCEVILLSADGRIVLGRRRLKTRSDNQVRFWPGAWSATLEEQMLRIDPAGDTPPDKDIFACAERGVEEETRAPVRPEETRILSYGIEWGNFTAAFLCLVISTASYNEIAKQWKRAKDRNEIIALDSLPADDPEEILKSLSRDEWSPSKKTARTWMNRGAIAPGPWHPTARARLYSYLKYFRYRQSVAVGERVRLPAVRAIEP